MSIASLTGGRSKDQGQVGANGGRSGAGRAEWERAEPSQAELWRKIKSFELDRAGDSFPFSARLARENGWSRSHALRVVEEYRRFVYLMATSPHPVTPSEAVDQAWHLHMTYTRSYWQGLCRGVVGRDLHHDPTRGGGDETAKFTDWYARTLDSYRRVFGYPPEDVWPPADRRFEPTRMQWVDLAAFKLVPRKRTASRWAWLGVAAGGLGAIGCGGTMNNTANGLGAFLCVFIAVVAVLIVIAAALSKQTAAGGSGARKQRTRRSSSDGCGGSPFIYTPGVFDNSTPTHGHGGHHGHGDGTSGGSHGHGHGCGHGHGGDGGGHGCSSGDGGSSGCSSGGDSGGGCGGGGDGGGGCGGGGCGGGGD
ncbi:MAG: hypothetical protein QM783_06360 [Phycisphaerales bacterium]